ncbi:MAG: hypothetical protein D6722_22365 [Bacteroidetes bacterium]|nr:MAG: hypothetical protein D6722_22365 [Bacteroidota bacterium]
MDFPAQTADIFERLSRGLFISANSLDREQAELFRVIDAHFETLETYFATIRFRLERGDDFFYFSRERTPSQLEDKIERLYRYIDWLDFLKAYDPALGPGYRLSPEQIALRCQQTPCLSRKLSDLPLRGTATQRIDRARLFLRSLERASFLELENEAQEVYLVLNAFSYLEALIQQIELSQDA